KQVYDSFSNHSSIAIDPRRYSCINQSSTHTSIYALSLHDALPICTSAEPTRPTTTTPTRQSPQHPPHTAAPPKEHTSPTSPPPRSEEHTSELQSRENIVCRLLLEKKNGIEKTCMIRFELYRK